MLKKKTKKLTNTKHLIKKVLFWLEAKSSKQNHFHIYTILRPNIIYYLCSMQVANSNNNNFVYFNMDHRAFLPIKHELTFFFLIHTTCMYEFVYISWHLLS